MSQQKLDEIVKTASSSFCVPIRTEASNGVIGVRTYIGYMLIHDVPHGEYLASIRLFSNGEVKITSPRGLVGLMREYSSRIQMSLVAARHKHSRQATTEHPLLDPEKKK